MNLMSETFWLKGWVGGFSSLFFVWVAKFPAHSFSHPLLSFSLKTRPLPQPFGGAWMDHSPMLCGKKGADRFLVLSATALFTHGDLIFKIRFFRKNCLKE